MNKSRQLQYVHTDLRGISVNIESSLCFMPKNLYVYINICMSERFMRAQSKHNDVKTAGGNVHRWCIMIAPPLYGHQPRISSN